MKTYDAEIDYGHGGTTEIAAETLTEAWAAAVGWVLDGDWPECGCTVDLRVELRDDAGEIVEDRGGEVHMPYVDPPCPDEDDGHDWRIDWAVGCKENPGVTGHGSHIHTSYLCSHCGARKIEDYGRHGTDLECSTHATFTSPDENIAVAVREYYGLEVDNETRTPGRLISTRRTTRHPSAG